MFIYGMLSSIIEVFKMILENVYFMLHGTYEINHEIIYNIYKSMFKLTYTTNVNTTEVIKFDKKIKLGLLTNEIPPIVYGGVATWIVNFIKMFENDVPIDDSDY